MKLSQVEFSLNLYIFRFQDWMKYLQQFLHKTNMSYRISFLCQNLLKMMNLGHDSEATLIIALSTKSTKACEETKKNEIVKK